ncbi:branched-chain amino acid ABC transporter permease [Nocardioides dongxiaopingii]|jgi:ABC-type branched-subunit amino acid transport system permease subunit|uniref:branched-chain amino acid ABC transporter permease n=1 Tax=Nocardioides TaxID=1839 RepID=UPI0010C7621E|nr:MULTISPECIES: branched-chain amino acid ABC transporter permease [Nocardioides]QDH10837.1 branched-chain amino acid ABC transporter permease [Nocardioides sp. S-1144]
MDLITTPLHDAFAPVAISYVLAAMGLNIHYGYTGLLNFGQAAFAAAGSYAMAVMIVSFGVPFIPAILLGLAASVVLSLVMGVPTLRLRADYLAIVTIAVAEILRLLFSTSFKEYFHARDGVSGFTGTFRSWNPFQDMEGTFLSFSANDLWVMIVGWIIVALVSTLVFLLMRSPWGRVLKSIREDEDAVRSLGKNVYGYKMQALVLGGMIGAMGGFVGALGLASVQPDTFNTDFTFIAFTMLILGGAARVLSPAVGAVLFWGVLSFMSVALSELSDIVPGDLLDSNRIGNIRFAVVGLVLMLLMIYRPQGLFGDRKEIAIDAR